MREGSPFTLPCVWRESKYSAPEKWKTKWSRVVPLFPCVYARPIRPMDLCLGRSVSQYFFISCFCSLFFSLFFLSSLFSIRVFVVVLVTPMFNRSPLSCVFSFVCFFFFLFFHFAVLPSTCSLGVIQPGPAASHSLWRSGPRGWASANTQAARDLLEAAALNWKSASSRSCRVCRSELASSFSHHQRTFCPMDLWPLLLFSSPLGPPLRRAIPVISRRQKRCKARGRATH